MLFAGHRRAPIIGLACLLLLTATAAHLGAQAITQQIQGLVTDTTGAVIPGATVTITNVNTQISQTRTTNETGNYSFPQVQVGNYSIRCEMQGFKADVVPNQRVETGAQVRRDFRLEVGEVTETVEVSAAAVTLNTENAVVGGVVENKRIIELAGNIPRLGRLSDPDASATAHSKLCGSTVKVDLKMDGPVVTDFAHDVKACALGQASSSIMARHVVGSTASELRELRETVRKMLKENGAPPQGDKWADIAALEPVRDFKARHASTLLTFDAVVDAIGQIEAKSGQLAPAQS